MNPKRPLQLVCLLTTLLLSLLILTLAGSAEEISVDDDGDADFSTITGAIEAAQDGDIIHVAAGRYEESIFVNKSLTIIGGPEGGSEIVVSPQDGHGGYGTGLEGAGILITSNEVIFENFILSRNDLGANTPGIEVREAQNVSIANCTISRKFFGGVSFTDGRNISLLNCTLEGLFKLNGTRNSTVENSTVHSWVSMQSGSSGNQIVNSTCKSLIGVTEESDNNQFSGNIFEGMYLRSSFGNTIENNAITHSISITNSRDVFISENSFTSGGIHFPENENPYEMFESTTITPTNMINGKPIIYLAQESNHEVPENAGQVILAYCDSIIVPDLDIIGGEGVFLYNTTNTTIRDSDIQGTVHGILLRNCDGITITNISVKDGIDDGIQILQCSNVEILGIEVENCSQYGIRIDNLANGSVSINGGIVKECGVIGIRIRGNGVILSAVHFYSNQEAITIEGDENQVIGMTAVGSSIYAGIRIAGSRNLLQGCAITEAEDGVSLDGGVNNTIRSSTFQNNTNGITITQYSGQNAITNCTFLNNSEYGIVIENFYASNEENELALNTFKGNGKGDVLIIKEDDDSPDGDKRPSTEAQIILIIFLIFIGVGMYGVINHRKGAPPKVQW